MPSINIYIPAGEVEKYERLRRLSPARWGQSLSEITREWWDLMLDQQAENLARIEKERARP